MKQNHDSSDEVAGDRAVRGAGVRRGDAAVGPGGVESRGARAAAAPGAPDRALFENEHTVMLLVAPEDGRLVDANPAAANFYGYPRDVLATMHVSALDAAGARPPSGHVAGGLSPSVPPQPRHSRHRLADGAIRDVAVSSGPVILDGRELIFAVVHDVSAQRGFERQVALQVGALDAAANAIVITDAGGRIEWVNAAFRAQTGYSDAEALGRTPGELVKSGEHDAGFYREMWETLLEGRVWSGELMNRRKDGSRYLEEMTITPMRDAGGEITHFVAVKQDISERKRLEKQLLRSQRLESIGTLAGGIAHDLNNVLAPILMSVDLLRMGETDPERLESVASIEASAERGASLIRQVLAFARGVDEPTVAVDLRGVADDIAKLVRDTFPKAIRFDVACATDLWPVRADPNQIHQVVMNLCVNARDAMPSGGRLTLRVRNVHLDAMYVEMHPVAQPGAHVVLEVQDSGTGIPVAERERIFDPFFTTKAVGQGTGLGLATVDTIVRGHRGFIELESEPGHGTTFAVYLPATPEAGAPAPAPDRDVAEPPRGRGELVLVVDDEARIREATRAILVRHGYSVVVADHGADAVHVFAQRVGEVAAVVLDMAMPIMDGRATTVALRSIDPEVRVIGTSGHTSAADVMRALDAGVARFIPKPYHAETLLRALDDVLRPPR